MHAHKADKTQIRTCSFLSFSSIPLRAWCSLRDSSRDANWGATDSASSWQTPPAPRCHRDRLQMWRWWWRGGFVFLKNTPQWNAEKFRLRCSCTTVNFGGPETTTWLHPFTVIPMLCQCAAGLNFYIKVDNVTSSDLIHLMLPSLLPSLLVK